MTYTPEPWSISDAPYQIVGPVGQTIAKLTSLDMDNACRIVAAVNAVAGMPQDDLEELAKVEGGVMSLTVYADDMRQRVEKLEADYSAQGLALKAAKAMQAGETERADRAEALRDQLLAALESIAGSKDDPNFGWRGRSKNKDELACEYCGEASIDCTEIDHRHDCPVPQAFSAIVAVKEGGST